MPHLRHTTFDEKSGPGDDYYDVIMMFGMLPKQDPTKLTSKVTHISQSTYEQHP